MKDHILSEEVAKHNGILEHCMYCNDVFDENDEWKVENNWFSSYISVKCSSCKREHGFQDKNIHTIEDLIEKINKK